MFPHIVLDETRTVSVPTRSGNDVCVPIRNFASTTSTKIDNNFSFQQFSLPSSAALVIRARSFSQSLRPDIDSDSIDSICQHLLSLVSDRYPITATIFIFQEATIRLSATSSDLEKKVKGPPTIIKKSWYRNYQLDR